MTEKLSIQFPLPGRVAFGVILLALATHTLTAQQQTASCQREDQSRVSLEIPILGPEPDDLRIFQERLTPNDPPEATVKVGALQRLENGALRWSELCLVQGERYVLTGWRKGKLRAHEEFEVQKTPVQLIQVRLEGAVTAAANGGPPPPPPPEERPREITVFYATNRNLQTVSATGPNYGGDRGQLRYGVAKVAIPPDHRAGAIESPRWYLLEFRYDPEKHVTILSKVDRVKSAFFAEMRAHVEADEKRQALVFVHGYNVSFDDALRRTAQITYDLGFKGAPVTFSWPSRGATAAYTIDENNADWSVPHLREFLNEFAAQSGAQKLYVVAHSMGNRILARALDSAFPRIRLTQVILTAPDIDAAVFEQMAEAIRASAERVTLYASSNDRALIASKQVHGYRRAGEGGDQVVVIDGVDTIDASLLDSDFLGHSYYGDHTSVLADIFYLLSGLAPDKRFGLCRRSRADRFFYIFRPELKTRVGEICP